MKNPLKRWDVFLALVFFLIAIPAEYGEVFSLLEDQTISYRQIFRTAFGDPAVTGFSDDLVLVSLDEALYEEYGSFPFRRTDLGKIARTLSQLGARVVALDILMDFRSSYDEDEPTAEMFKEAGNVVLVSRAEFDENHKFTRLVYPTETLREVTRSGYSNIEPTSAIIDNLARLRVYKEITNNRDGWPFAIQALAMYLGEEPKLTGSVVTIGDDIRVALDQFSDFYIDFPRLPPGAQYLHEGGVSALEILDLEDADPDELEEWSYLFDGKIVFVGDTWEVSHDKFNTPVGQVYGVEIIADAVNTLLHGAPLRPASVATEILASFLFMLVLLTTCLVQKPIPRVLLALVIFVAYVAVVSALYIYEGLVLSMTYSLIAGFFATVFINLRFYLLSERSQEVSAAHSAESSRMLGLAYQGQGQLDAAFEKYRTCPRDDATHELLYNLGLDFERRRQFNKAQFVYEYIAEGNGGYRDVQNRIKRAKSMEEAVLLGGGKGTLGGTLISEDGTVEKPMLGRYRVERELGQGAMGIVYLGTDPKINRQVAIKTLALSQEFDADELTEVKERFFREAESAGRLNHPNIVSIYDAGEEHDLAYIAMELLKGHDLDEHIKPDTLLPLEEVLDIVTKCADALNYAHAQNVVHRDIKPANIMYEPEQKIVKITDFGIARITDSSKTRTGTVLGTPNYMSPEQCMGKKVDGRADLFSLGVVLYQLASGELPFKGESMATLMYSIVNDAPVDIRKVRPDVPATLRKVIHNALGKKPGARYQNGKQMAEHLIICKQRLGQETKAAAS